MAVILLDVSIIIVNYDTESHLRKCLDSAIKYTKDVEFEIIVIDNNSPNRAIEGFSVLYPMVNFQFRKINDGFGAGCNYGASISKGRYLLFVNPDLVLKSNVVKGFMEFFESSLDVVLCSGLFEDRKGDVMYSFNEFPNLRLDFKEAFSVGYNRHIRKLLDIATINTMEPFEIDYPLGALMFLEREAFFAVNGFDERFFLYCEDMDIGYRLKQKGKKIYCLPWVRVFHYLNSAVEGFEGKRLQKYHMCRSKLIYMYKHYSFLQRTLVRFMMLIGLSLRLVYVLLNAEFRSNRIYNFKRILHSMSLFFYRIDIDKLGKYYYHS